jgi:hypothetical protein
MGYVQIDPPGARRLGEAMVAASADLDLARSGVLNALMLAGLDSGTPEQLAAAHDGLSKTGTAVSEKAKLAEQSIPAPPGMTTRMILADSSTPNRGTITYTDEEGRVQALPIRPGGEYSIPREHLFRDSRVPYFPPYSLIPPGGADRDWTIDLPDGTRFHIVPKTQDIPHSELPIDSETELADADSVFGEAAVFGQDLLSADLSGSLDGTMFEGLASVPGTSFAEAPLGWVGFGPYSGDDLQFASIGNSFLSGLGALDPSLYVGPQIMGQSRDAGVLQAMRQLAIDYNADLDITYTSDRSVQQRPALFPTIDPLGFSIVQAATAGANTSEILGRSLTKTHPESPPEPQINHLQEVDVAIVESGFNDRARARRDSGIFAEGAEEALLPQPWGSGADDINRLTQRVTRATALIPDLLDETSKAIDPNGRIAFLAPGWFLSPLDGQGQPLALPPERYRPPMMGNIDRDEYPALFGLWSTTVDQLRFDVNNVELQPGQQIDFVLPSFAGETLMGATGASGVNGIIFDWGIDPNSLHPNNPDIYANAILPVLREDARELLGPPPEPSLSPFQSFGGAGIFGQPEVADLSQAIVPDLSQEVVSPGRSVSEGLADPAMDVFPTYSGTTSSAHFLANYPGDPQLSFDDSFALENGFSLGDGFSLDNSFSLDNGFALDDSYSFGGDLGLDNSYSAYDPFESFSSPVDFGGGDMFSGMETASYDNSFSVSDYF